jgi:ribonuclease J
MKIVIHRGSKQVGGTCVEIEQDGKRLLIDLGLPLDADIDDTPLPGPVGIDCYEKDLLGLIISHVHIDHYGLASKISSNIPVLIGNSANNILDASRIFFPDTINFQNKIFLYHKVPVKFGPFKITPYLVDHSAYDAYALLVEAGGKQIFYSGDFRSHGRKSKLFKKLTANPPENIDVLLMEGSTIGRHHDDCIYPTERDLEAAFQKKIDGAKSLILVWASGQNIDRLVTLYKACRKTGKKMVVDMYTSNILRTIGNKKLPQPGWKDFFVFLPRFQRKKIIASELFEFAKSFSSYRIYPEELKNLRKEIVMLFRPSMVKDLEFSGCIDDAGLIYSMWPGYLEQPRMKWFLKWLEKNQIPLDHCHTSGHSSVKDLKKFASAMNARKLVPIHTFEPDAYKDLFKNVELKQDGESWTV